MMAVAVGCLRRLGLVPLFLAGVLVAVVMSVSTVRAQPFCEGARCNPEVSNDCGSKCVCNSVEKVCLDNTQEE